MAQELTTISPLFSTPYLTVAEYRQAPTAVDVNDLVSNGSTALNDAELTNVIGRASSWMDSHCGQVLAATQDTESFRARVSRDGFLRVHPRYWPIVSVISASFGSNPQLMQTLDPTTAWLEPQAVVFPLTGAGSAYLGALQLGPSYSPLAEQFVTITYWNGYANTLLNGTVSVGAASISVTDRTGFAPGQPFIIYDGASTERLTVASSYTPATGAGLVTLATAATASHTTGLSVSALPPAVKQAAIYMVNVLLKSRGNSALVMGGITPAEIVSNNPAVSNDYAMACDLLEPFRRVR